MGDDTLAESEMTDGKRKRGEASERDVDGVVGAARASSIHSCIVNRGLCVCA